MPTNEGLLRENEMIVALNNKTVKELGNNLRSFMKNLFGVLEDDKTIKCYKVDNSYKTDIVVEYNDCVHFVSMKSGNATIVHNEILANFIDYLRSEGISEETLETIILHHYGDGTTDGTGSRRLNSKEVHEALKERIFKANAELNYDLTLVKRAVNRLMFKGVDEDNIEADALYFGDRDYGIVVNRNQIMKHINRRSFDFYDLLHIGPLLIRPDARYIDKEVADLRKRNRMVAYWPNLQADVRYISKHYDYDYNRLRF